MLQMILQLETSHCAVRLVAGTLLAHIQESLQRHLPYVRGRDIKS